MRRLILILMALVAFLLLQLPAIAAGKEKTRMTTLTITSAAFTNGAAIPARYTCEGADVSPPLGVTNLPAGVRTLALIMDDPDAPGGTWVHWVVWNIPAQLRDIHENSVPGTNQGKNSWGRNAYGGPCPPSGVHRYFFKFFALDRELKLGMTADKGDLERAMQGHVLAKGVLMGTYGRK